ncbi:MAG: endonuclease dU [Candidatus Heimdallarchaeaceae archaeon]
MKTKIRTIGIDDAAFDRNRSKKTFIFGVITRGYDIVEGILRSEIEVDGLDATEKIIKMIQKSKFVTQLKTIFLASSTIAAFNVIDMNALYEQLDIPVITILSKKPDEEKIRRAIMHLEDGEKRYNTLFSNPPMKSIKFKNQIGREFKAVVQYVGIDEINEVREIIEKATFTSFLPESLRIADLIGQTFKDYIIK